MEEQIEKPVRSNHGWLSHAVILLIAIAGGAGLVYSLRPSKPPPAQVLYEISFISADNPITDFQLHFQAMQQGVAPATLGGQGSMVGGIQLTALSKQPVGMGYALPGMWPTAITPGPFGLMVKGESLSKRVHTDFTVSVGRRSISHRLEQGDGEIRALELSANDTADGRHLYALVRATQIQPAPASSRATRVSPPPGAETTEKE